MPKNIEWQVGSGVAHVWGVVDGGAAVVPGHAAASLRHKQFFLPDIKDLEMKAKLFIKKWYLSYNHKLQAYNFPGI